MDTAYEKLKAVLQKLTPEEKLTVLRFAEFLLQLRDQFQDLGLNRDI